MAEYDDSPDLHCSFCGKRRVDVEFIITGACVCICSECTELCAEILELRRLCWCPKCGASTDSKPPLGPCYECGATMTRADPAGEYAGVA
jgi:hypothetical protein